MSNVLMGSKWAGAGGVVGTGGVLLGTVGAAGSTGLVGDTTGRCHAGAGSGAPMDASGTQPSSVRVADAGSVKVTSVELPRSAISETCVPRTSAVTRSPV